MIRFSHLPVQVPCIRHLIDQLDSNADEVVWLVVREMIIASMSEANTLTWDRPKCRLQFLIAWPICMMRRVTFFYKHLMLRCCRHGCISPTNLLVSKYLDGITFVLRKNTRGKVYAVGRFSQDSLVVRDGRSFLHIYHMLTHYRVKALPSSMYDWVYVGSLGCTLRQFCTDVNVSESVQHGGGRGPVCKGGGCWVDDALVFRSLMLACSQSCLCFPVHTWSRM